MDLSAQPIEAAADPILDAAFAAYQVEQRTLSRRYSAIVVLRIAAQSLRAEGLLPEVHQDGERLILSVAVPGLVAGGVPVAAPSVSPMAAVSLPDMVPVAARPDEDAPGDRWLDCAELCEGAEQKSEPKSETAAAPDVRAGQAVAPVSDVCPPSLASDAESGGGVATRAPAAAAAELADRLGDLGGGAMPDEPSHWRGYSAADDDLIVAEIAGAFARGEAKAAGVRAAADRLGRSAKAIDLRANGKLAERVRALKDAAPPVVDKAEAAAAASALVVAQRATVQARAVPAEAPAPESKGASVPDLDLRHHLEDLPRKLGKVAWFRPDDIALMEAHCARKKLAEVALDLRVDAKMLSARIDLLTGLHENDRGLKVARWSRTDVLAALKALGG